MKLEQFHNGGRQAEWGGPGHRASLVLLPLNPGSFLATVLISEAANMSHCLGIRVVLNSGHES